MKFIKKTISANQLGFAYAYVHFAVEICCFFFVFSRFNASPLWWAVALLFDALAFITQMFWGLLADKTPHIPYGIIGCVAILISLWIPVHSIGLVILALGNALAHVDGAEHTLRASGSRITPTGLFVGGGSFGVITGQLLGMYASDLLWIPVCIILPAIWMLCSITMHRTIEKKPWHCPITISSRSDATVTLLAFAVVAVRAYIAYAIPTDWNKTPWQAILLFTMMGVGKIAGGILADTIGHYSTAWISSLLSLPLLMFGNAHMTVSLLGVGLFSMTMPITIAVLISRFPSRPGFAFGITTVGLFCGTLPAFFIQPHTLQEHQATVAVLVTLALVALLLCLEKRSLYEKNS